MVIHMENRIHKVIKLETGLKYVILKQAVYKNNNYYIAAKLDKEENPISNDIAFFHEINGNKLQIEEVTDTDLIKYLYSYMQF